MKITSARFVMSNSNASLCPADGKPEYAFIGRSNVGKSSLINMLTGQSKLARTSATPGKTLLINHFLVNEEWYLVDLPGYGYARRSKNEQEKLRRLIYGYVSLRHQMTNLFVLIDSRLAPQNIDLEFINFLGANHVPFSIVFTKADKLGKQALDRNVETFMNALKETWDVLPPHFVTSAEKGTGRDDVLNYIETINKSLEKQD